MQISLAQILIATLWPSFMVAIVATGLFFSAFDPKDMYPFDLDVDISTMGAYTIGFFVFWILSAVSSGLAVYYTVTNYKAAAAIESSRQKYKG